MKQHPPARRRDLVIAVPDADIEIALAAIIGRPESLGTRPIEAILRRLPGRDPGCRTRGVDFLRMYCDTFEHALIVFDYDGSGASIGPAALEAELEQRLAANGWQDRAAVIVIDPEIEAWVWSGSRHVDRVAGWSQCIPALREWLVDEGFNPTARKPDRPKEAFQRALRYKGKRPSPALFKELAERVSLKRCTDVAFQKLVTTLQSWFPVAEHEG